MLYLNKINLFYYTVKIKDNLNNSTSIKLHNRGKDFLLFHYE